MTQAMRANGNNFLVVGIGGPGANMTWLASFANLAEAKNFVNSPSDNVPGHEYDYEAIIRAERFYEPEPESSIDPDSPYGIELVLKDRLEELQSLVGEDETKAILNRILAE